MLRNLLAPAALFGAVMSAPLEDKVESLPQMETFPYGVYSGYIPVKENNYHYMFLESQNDTVNDPVLIWFNGGPGCSSMLGFAQEIGPWAMADEDDEFKRNPYSWNNFANVLFIESPAGVGFSFCESTESCIYNDDNSAEDNYQVILSWMTEKFPEFAANDLYISGESYAGIYVPYVSRLIHLHNMNETNEFKFNFKGWMVGNGVTNWKYDGVPSFIEMGYWHGLYQTSLYNDIMKCDLEYFDFRTESLSDECMNLVMTWYNETENIFIYDIYKSMVLPDEEQTESTDVPRNMRVFESLKMLLQKRADDSKPVKKTNRIDLLGYNYAPWMSGMKKAQVSDPCPYQSPLVQYFNNDEVRANLHIPDYVGLWDMCNNTYNYTASEKGSQWIWEEMKASGQNYRLLKYSGDTDGAVPTIGSEHWINELNWDVLEKYRPYFLENKHLGGYIEVRDGLTFATVHGAGHMVPQYKRAESFYLIKNWIQGNKI